jgi:hypothetical protein
MSDLIRQGEHYLKKKKEGMKQMFSNKKEGFSGILGANDSLNLVNNNELAATNDNVYSLTQNMSSFRAAETTLQDKTNQYLNTTKTPKAGDDKRNYNVFINKNPILNATTTVVTGESTTGPGGSSSASRKRSANADETTQQCVSIDTLNHFIDGSANGFDAAYPNNFTVFEKAREACQMWASDLGYSFFGVTKPENKFKCYTSAVGPPKLPPNFATPGALYTVATNPETTTGGLFSNGQIGVYRSHKNQRWTIQNMNKPLLLKHYNNADYSTGPQPWPQAIDHNWWGWSKIDWGNPKYYWGLNKFPKEQYPDFSAWWVGNINNLSKLVDKWGGDKSASVGADGSQSYFYYVYNSTIPNQTVAVYVVLGGAFKVNGKVQTDFVADGQGIGAYSRTYTVALALGKNVFEMKNDTGLPSSGFVMYVYDPVTNGIFFTTGMPGWGVTTAPCPDWRLVADIPPTAQTLADPYLFATVNNEPDGFSTCDKLIGGSINTKTINATYGKNCSTSTKKPLNVRYIKISANEAGDPVQISQLVVTAFLNGISQNVASRGTLYIQENSAGYDSGTSADITINGKTDNVEYWKSGRAIGNYWQLDLGTEFPLISLAFYNRPDFNQYANGMTISLKNGGGTTYTLKTSLRLTGQLVQTFAISVDDVIMASPTYIVAPPGFVAGPGQLGYGIYSGEVAQQICAARGQRICQKSELALYDSCAAGWNDDLTTMGHPMAHGDNECKGDGKNCGYCGGMTPGTAGFSPWVTWNAAPAGVYCCDKDHVGIYDPVKVPIMYNF